MFAVVRIEVDNTAAILPTGWVDGDHCKWPASHKKARSWLPQAEDTDNVRSSGDEANTAAPCVFIILFN
ncbi:uncharacterized protein LOC125944277 [Dermacentor silvarum]|uniref:uncharacterized protein LOC125944277 n=1 Tax=Dermacentor silvarum TaxID=543639 RepID=UPI0021018E08|nr:uncharacterized protein LOC125944277 [Dermacentor silvarum]